MSLHTLPPRIQNISCVKCGSTAIAQGIPIQARIHYGVHLAVDTDGIMDEYTQLYCNMCSNCGHLEMRVHPDEAKRLYKAYQKLNR